MNIVRRIRTILSRMERIDNIVNDNVVRQFYQEKALHSTDKGISSDNYPEGELIVTLTSYGDKLHSLYLTIESLLHQSLKPNKILLWLDKNKYYDINNIPLTLQKQTRRGLEIRLCEDVRSYTKLVPTIVNYPNAVVISVDDDILYPIDFVERLYRAYQRDSSKVYFYRGHYMLFENDGLTAKSYIDWVKHGAKGCDIYNFPTGVSGVLYPPHCFYEDVSNKELFLKLCPTADDVWFKVMTYLKGVVCEKIDVFNYDKLFVPIDIDERSSLQSINVKDGANDEQIKNVFNHYHIRMK